MKSGFIAVVGRPNVGKSTLVNALVGEKVAITSSRPQTTRNAIRGILTTDAAQFVFVDTPGLHRPRTALGSRLNRLVYGSLEDADAALLVLDATQKVGPGDRLIAGRLADTGIPVVVVVNKIDIAAKAAILVQLGEAAEWGFAAYVPVSAKDRDGIDLVITELAGMLDDGPRFFPPETVTDQPDRLFAGELIREKYLERLHQELPHSLAVVVDEIETRENGMVYVGATVYVERKSQKGIVIGRGGSVLREIGEEARRDLERLFGASVYLDLRVKVESDWQRHEQSLDRLGF